MAPNIAINAAGVPNATGSTLPGFRFIFGSTLRNTLELAISPVRSPLPVPEVFSLRNIMLTAYEPACTNLKLHCVGMDLPGAIGDM